MQLFDRAVQLLQNSEYTVTLTGAGISTPSGIPDFRSPTSGLWDNANPILVASIIGFKLSPKAFYDWIRPLAQTTRDAQPNPAHLALARMEGAGKLRAVITQNIDLLHRRAGSCTVHEVHGSLQNATCIRCFREYPTASFLDDFITHGGVPKCPECGGVLKPNVILFGEALPVSAINAANQAARRSQVMIVAGSSLKVAPVCDLPVTALDNGAKLIMVNREPTHLDSRASVVLTGDVADILPRLASALGC